MVMTIIHIAYITCLVTNDTLYAYDVIGIYKILHGAGRILYFTQAAMLWLASCLWARTGPIAGGACPPGQEARPLVRKNIVLINQHAHEKLFLSWS